MKKIAIMTWYKYRNYGTALQCSALFQKIKELGHSPTLISYNTSAKKYLFPERETVFKVAQSALKRRFYKGYLSSEREKKFADFLTSHTTETTLCTNYSELYEQNYHFDAFVCGSDQVWSPTSFDDKYYLSFADDSKKKIAYAPSFGAVKISNPYQKDIIKGLLKRMDHISVREEQGGVIVHDLIAQKPPVVLDPTLLLNSNEWDELVETPKCDRIEHDYILCYFLGDENRYLKNVKKISRMLGIPYYIIPVFAKQANSKNRVPFEVGPEEFVSLIKHAKYVCTDSFHGMAFSINYNIPFSIYKRFSDKDPFAQNSRIYNLLNLLDLNSRLQKECYLSPMEYSNCNVKLNELRLLSEKYLKTALESEKRTEINHLTGQVCTGCTACASICPTKAVTVSRNEQGFYHYAIDLEHCIDCGACKRICPVLNKSALEIVKAEALFAVQHCDEKVLMRSSSGGAGYAIAAACLRRGISVCGVTYDKEEAKAKHIIIKQESELPLLQGSKYISSDVGSCLKELAEQDGEFVFFGTPCQIAGMDRVLRQKGKRQNALLVDLICHGVPSLLLWDKYLAECKAQQKMKNAVDCTFRDKTYGWHNKVISLVEDSTKKTYSCPEKKDLFYAFFDRPIAYMSSCYECQFRTHSSADIRIGDFWGEKYREDQHGVSMVIANNRRGLVMIGSLNDVRIQEYSIEDYAHSQYLKNPQKPINYLQVLQDAGDPKCSMEKMRKKYCTVYRNREILQHAKNAVKKITKK